MKTDAEREAARQRLAAFAPCLKIAYEMTRVEIPDGKVEMGILGTRPDGSGRITFRFELDDFMRDLEILIGEVDPEPGEPVPQA